MRTTLFLIMLLLLLSQLNARQDPFVWPSKKDAQILLKTIVLEGIVCSGSRRNAAVLSCGLLRAVVQRGQQFAGYKLLRIGKKFVELARGKEKKKLFIE